MSKIASHSGINPTGAARGFLSVAEQPLDRFIDRELAQFDPAFSMTVTTVGPNPYHTSLKAGTRVHATRSSADLAVALLRRNKGLDATVAAAILAALLDLQDRDPASPTCGVWPYYAEETLAEMNPPDHNWADFLATRLCHVLIEHPAKIPAALLARVEEALRLATAAIVRRDVSPEYTNIAIMGGGVACCAGEALGRLDWLSFGINKLTSVLASVERHGSFAEYNSPTYTLVALEEASRAVQLVRSPEARDASRRLATTCWRLIASHWHPGTHQWAGPHARSYSDLVSPALTATLSGAAGVTLGPSDATVDQDAITQASPVRLMPCPNECRERFVRLPGKTWVSHERFERGTAGEPDRYATTYFSDDFCIASFSRSTYWHQSRATIAYLKTQAGVAVLRPRVLMNGLDFASAGNLQAQSGSSVLSSVRFWTGAGAFHPLFGASADGAFDMLRLELRIELLHHPGQIECVTPGIWCVPVGAHWVHIYCPDSTFNNRPLTWAPAATDVSVALVAGLVNTDPPTLVTLSESDASIGFAIDISPSPSPRYGLPQKANEQFVWRADCELSVPIHRKAAPRAW